MFLYHQFCEMAFTNGEKAAIVQEGQTISYRQLSRFVEIFSVILTEYGIKSNSRLAIFLQQDYKYIITAMAAVKLGAVLIPVNTHVKPDAVSSMFTQLGVEIVVCDNQTEIKLPTGVSKLRFNLEMTESVFQKTSEIPTINASAPCILLTTSGSTGNPKAVCVSYHSFSNRVEKEFQIFQLSKEDRMLISMPLYHACGQRMMFTALCNGMTLYLLQGFAPSRWLNIVKNAAITYTMTAPAQLAQIVLNEQISGCSFPNLKLVSASSYLSVRLKRQVLEQLNCQLFNLYASSEADFIALDCCDNGDNGNLLGIPVTGVQLRVVSGGHLAEIGEIGEITCSSPWLFSGYYAGEAECPTTESDYFSTGDMGFTDDLHRLHYVGRKKNIIISGGVNIFPEDIESKIALLPAVQECIAYPIAHRILGEVIAVDIVVKSNEILNLMEVRKHCLKELADYQQPRQINFVDHIERNALGKIVRKMKPEGRAE